MSLEVAVVGPGAIGGAVAAALIQAGHEPVLCARTAFDRLIVEWPEGRIDRSVDVATDPSDVDPVDVVFVAVKAHHSEAARPWLAALGGAGTAIVVLQNGVEHRARFEPLVPDGAEIVPAVINLPGDRSEPGRVTVGRVARLTLERSAAADRAASLFDGSFVTADVVDDWLTPAWTKLMLNAASGGVCTLPGPTTASSATRRPGASRFRSCTRSPRSVRAEGATVTEGEDAVFILTRTGDPSAALDVTFEVTDDSAVLSGAPPARATFNADEDTARVALATADDGADEPDATLTLTLTDGDTYDLGTSSSAAVAVQDNDDLSTVTVRAVSERISEGETAEFELRRAGDTSVALRVEVDVSEQGGDLVSAMSEGIRRVTFEAGASTAQLRVATTDDGIPEPGPPGDGDGDGCSCGGRWFLRGGPAGFCGGHGCGFGGASAFWRGAAVWVRRHFCAAMRRGSRG